MTNERDMTVREMVNQLSRNELYKLHSDLKSGGRHLKQLVEERVRYIESRPKKICATCGTPLSDEEPIYTLTFGPPDFRKRASFCGQDCLEYFLERMKAIRPPNGISPPVRDLPHPPDASHPVNRTNPRNNSSIFRRFFGGLKK